MTSHSPDPPGAAFPRDVLIRLSGEVTTKGRHTRLRFQRGLARNLRAALDRRHLAYKLEENWSRLYLSPEPDEDRDLASSGLLDEVFGISSHDYWRFTPEGFKSLLRPFDSFFVDFAGEEGFPHTVVGIGFKGSITEEAMNEFKRRFEHWKAYAATRWKRLAKLTVSRTRLEIHRRIRGKPL